MKKIALIGGYGVGKSTLAFTFGKYLEKQGYSIEIANLDPGCKHLKYMPVFDIRKFHSIEETMKESKLGPGGALRKIFENLSENKKFVKEINSIKSDILILDFAGSLELFLLEGANDLLKKTSDLVLFVCDRTAIKTEEDLLLLKSINAIQCMKYLLPTITVVNKTDLIKKEKQKKLPTLEGGFQAVNENLFKLLEAISRKQPLVFVSAIERTGYSQLMDAINEVNCECGE